MSKIDSKYIDEVVDKILKMYTRNIDEKDDVPTAVILGGQPGAGKTIL